jgi:signal transduction histidine kinase/DNA-binding response OmpR family regulator
MEKQNDKVKNILIAEDDDALNALLQRIVKRKSYEAKGVVLGKEVIEKISTQNYTLLLLDYKLPDMRADQVIETLKKNGTMVPFVVMTGYGDESIAVNMMKLGARDYIIKEGNYLEQLPHIIDRLIHELEIEKKYMVSQSQLKESEEKLKLEHEQLLSIYESITEPICVTDIETYEILFSNSAFHEHFGNNTEKQCFKQIYKFEEPCIFCPVPFLKQQHIQAYYWEYHNQITKHWYRYVDKLIQWPTGKKVHFQLAFDITNMKLTELEIIKAKEKAEKADRLKTAFLANMSHEIRTPMNAIMGFTELLLKQEIDPKKQKEFLRIIQQRGGDLLQIIDDILDISRIESGSLEIIETPGDLDGLFQEIYQYYLIKEYLSGKKRPIEFLKKVTLSPDQIQVNTDFLRVKQIITNLLDNAFKFTNSGTIEFGCKVTDKKELLFYVKDTGIGIPPEKNSLIFDRFAQVGNSHLTRKTDGVGLGLSISKGLVEIMKGKIWCQSVEKEGTNFYFTLPFEPVQKIKETSPEVVEKVYHWNDKTVLVVEDDPFNVTLISEYLKSTGLKCIYARNGSDAIEIFHQKPSINLVLMDIRLPDANGLELTKQMKSLNPGIIVIAQTAYAYSNDKNYCINSGCDDFVTKPLLKDKLLELIDKHLKRTAILK